MAFIPLSTRIPAAILAATLLVTTACGSDEPETTTAETSEPTTTGTPAGASDELCGAYLDFRAAQDGAETNTALGTMESELPADAPQEVIDAIDTLGTGDLDPEESVAAGATLAAWMAESCGDVVAGFVSEALCAAWVDYENAEDGAQLNTALGIIAAELPADAPQDVMDALDTLNAGDVAPQDTADAAATVGDWIDESC